MLGRGADQHAENLSLPLEMWYHTFGFLKRYELLRVREVCTSFKALVDQPLLSKTIPDYKKNPSSRMQIELNNFWSWSADSCAVILSNGDIAFCHTQENFSEISIIGIQTGKCNALLSLRADDKDAQIPFKEIKALPGNGVASVNANGQICIWDVTEKTCTKLPETIPYRDECSGWPQLLVTHEGDIIVPKEECVLLYSLTGELKKQVALKIPFKQADYFRILADGELLLCSLHSPEAGVLDLESGDVTPCAKAPNFDGTKLPDGTLIRIIPNSATLVIHDSKANRGIGGAIFVGENNERIVAIKVTDNHNLICFCRDEDSKDNYKVHILEFPKRCGKLAQEVLSVNASLQPLTSRF
jgi:hypothetical protein